MKEEDFTSLLCDEHLEQLLLLAKGAFEEGGQSKLAFKLLLKLQNTVSDTKNPRITGKSIESVEKLTELCCKFINYDQENWSKFICGLHHICKFFITQGEIEPTLRLREFFFTSRLQGVDEMFLRVCNATFFLLHNLIKEKVKGKLAREDWLKLMDNLRESFEFLVRCGDKFLNVIFTHTAVILGLEKILAPPQLSQYQEDSLNFQISVLDMIQKIVDDKVVDSNVQKTFLLYIQLVSSMVMACVKKGNFTKAVEILENMYCLKTTEKMHALSVSIFKDILVNMLGKGSSCKLDQSISLLEYLKDSSGYSKDLHFVCSHITMNLAFMTSNWLENSHTWKVQSVIRYYGLILAITDIVTSTDIAPCILSSGAKCQCDRNSRIPLSILLETFQWPLNFTTAHLESVESIFPKVFAVQLHCFKLLKEMKSRFCMAWEECWEALGRRTHNVGCLLQKKGHFALAEKLLYAFCEEYLQVQTLSDGSNQRADMLRRNLLDLSHSLIEAKSYEKALVCTALTAALFPNEHKEAMKLWIATKRTALANENLQVQNLTVADIFAEQCFKVKRLFPDFNDKLIQNFRLQDLLLWELQTYNSQRAAMSDSIFAAVKSLISEAPANYVAEGLEILLRSVWSKDESDVDKNLASVVEVGLSRLHNLNEDDENALVCLGNVYYYDFLRKLVIARKKMGAAVKSFDNLIPTEVQSKLDKGEMEQDDICDVVPAYYDLTIAKEEKLLLSLKKAVDAWAKFFDCVSLSSAENFNAIITNLLPNVENTAYIYWMFGCELYSLQTWLLLYKCGSAVKNKQYTLLGLCYLLEYSDDIHCEYWKEALKLASELEKKEMTPAERAAVQTYWLCRSHCCWRNKQYKEGLDLLLKLKNFKSTGSTIFELHYIRSHLILSKYLSLPSTEFIPNHLREAGYITAILYAFSSIQKLIKSITTDTILENCLLHCTAIEVSEWVGELYLRLRLPRDLNCYLKLKVVYAQMMFLPTRTVQFLSKMAQMDAYCYKIDECEVKVNGILSILRLNSSVSALKKNDDIEDAIVPDCMKELEIIEDLLRDENVTGRKLQRYRNTSVDPMSSPTTLRKEFFKLPSVASHSRGCPCITCNSITTHTLLLEINIIKAQTFIADEDKHILSYFNGAIKLAKLLQTSQTHSLKNFIEKAFPGSNFSIAPLQTTFLLAVAKIFHHYTNFLCRCRNYSKALKLNGVAAHILKEVSEVHTHIQNEVFSQQCNVLQNIVKKRDKLNVKEEDEDLLLPVADCVESRTPLTAIRTGPPKILLNDGDVITEDGSPPRRFPLSVVANLFPESSSDSDKGSQKTRNYRGKGKLKISKIINDSDSSSSSDLPSIVSKSPSALTNQGVVDEMEDDMFIANENVKENPVHLISDRMAKVLTVSQAPNIKRTTKISKLAPSDKSLKAVKKISRSAVSSEKSEDLAGPSCQKRTSGKIPVQRKENKVPLNSRKKVVPDSSVSRPLRKRV